MKSFYSAGQAATTAPIGTGYGDPRSELCPSLIDTCARVAVYEAPGAAPRVEDVAGAHIGEYIEALTTTVYELAHGLGGTIPYTAIREVTENFIHADFAEPVVSILDGGMTIRFADQGPGMPDKQRAVLPGFTTATAEMKGYIRGVGSGLPIVKDYLSFSGGSLVIEDNLGGGSVVTLFAKAESVASIRRPTPAEDSTWPDAGHSDHERPAQRAESAPALQPASSRLSNRQKQVLALVMESGSAGPSLVAKELGVGVSTAYRDLASLEDQGLITSEGGKRTLTEQGLACIDRFIAR